MKKTLVILHGWGSSKKSFEPLLNYLDKKIDVILFDLPGFGETPIERPYTLEDYLIFLNEHLESELHLRKIEKMILLGHSFGGALALFYTFKNPEKVEKLLLYNAAILRPNTFKIRFLNFLSKISKPFLKILPSKLVFFLKKVFYKFVVKSYDYFLADEVLKKTLANIRKDLREEAKMIKNKTYLLWGKKDKITPLKHGIFLEKIMPNAKLIVFDGEHSFHKENPEEFAKILNKIILEDDGNY
ncbi:MAG: alpha/beta hydrolase [Candidatus Pacebacteria bacterium]|jgi:pimeloyl-ACP methyl ester carboxylesterase|nr:alpha/beta hydrolase [Candidatus Paceibacterota bacterium]